MDDLSIVPTVISPFAAIERVMAAYENASNLKARHLKHLPKSVSASRKTGKFIDHPNPSIDEWRS
jgi:hypothetical protein